MELHDVNILGTFKCQDVTAVPQWSAEHEGRLVYVSTTNTFYFADNIQYNIVKVVKTKGLRQSRALDNNLNSNFYVAPDNITLTYNDELSDDISYIWNNKIPCYNIKNIMYNVYSLFTVPKTWILNTDIDFYIIYSTISDDIDTKIDITIDLYSSDDLLGTPIYSFPVQLGHTKFNEISTVFLNNVKLQFNKLPDVFGMKIRRTNESFIGNIKIIDIFLKQNNVKFDIFNSKIKGTYIVSDLNNYDLVNSSINYSSPNISNNDNGCLFLTSLWDSTSSIDIILPSPSPGVFFSIKKDKKIKTINISLSNKNLYIDGTRNLKIINDIENDDSIISFIATGIYEYQIRSRSSAWRDDILNVIKSSNSSSFFNELSLILTKNRDSKTITEWRNSTGTYSVWNPETNSYIPNSYINPTKSYSNPAVYKDFNEHEKFFGLNIGSDLNLYCIPFNSTSIFKLTLDNSNSGDLEFGNLSGNSKWAGGALAQDGNIYCAPYNSTTILKIIPGEIPSYITFGTISSSISKYIGAILGPDGNVYCIPYNSTSILKITPGETPIVEEILLPENIRSGNEKWYGGVLGPDGCIYCAPYNSTTILKINTNSGVISNVGTFATTTKKWCGGTIAEDGYIYFTPYYSNKLLQVRPGIAVSTSQLNISSSNHNNQSAVLGLDGLSYSFPTSNTIVSSNGDYTGTYIYTFLVNYLINGYNGRSWLYNSSDNNASDYSDNNPANFTSYCYYRGSILAPDNNIYMIRNDGIIYRYLYSNPIGFQKLSLPYLLSSYLNKL